MSQASERARETFLSLIDGYPHYDDIYVTYLKAGKYQSAKLYPIQEFLDSVTEFISSSQSGDGIECYVWHLKSTLLYDTEMYVVVQEFCDYGIDYDDESRGLNATISSDESIFQPSPRPKLSAREQRRRR